MCSPDHVTMTTTRSLPSALRWRHAATLCTAALVVGSALVMAPAAFAADDATPTPSATPVSPAPEPTPADGSGTIVAAARTGGIFQPGTDLVVDVRLTTGAADVTAGGTATLRIGAAALGNEGDISAWLSNEVSSAPLIDIGTVTVDPQDADASSAFEIRGSRIVSALTSLTPGVYPIQVSYVAGAVTRTDNAVISVPSADDGVAVVVPFTAPAISSGLLTPAALAQLTAADGDLTIAMRAAQQANVIVAVDPAVIAAMRVLGTAAPASVQSWLADFEALDNDIFALPFADPDIATLVSANAADLGPTSLNRYLDASFTEPDGATTPSPTAVPSTAPTLDELIAIPGARDDLAWPVSGTMTQATAEWAAAQGKTLLLSSAQVAATQPHVTLEATGADAFVYDAELSAALSLTVSEGDAVSRNDDLSVLLAHASVAADSRVLVAFDRGVEWDAAATTETLTALTAASNGRLTGDLLLRAETPVAASATAAPEPTDRANTLTSLLQNETPLAAMAVVLTDPTLITGADRAEVLQLFSAAWVGNAEWDAAVADHQESVAETLDAIDIAPISTIQFLTSGSSIPLQVRNDLPFPATLKLWAQPDDFRLTVESPTTVQAQAGAVTKVLIPVTAGLGNGDVTIRFWLTAENGHEIGAPMYTDVLVRAEWEKIGVAVSVALVILLFAGGIYRTVNKRRRARTQTEYTSAIAPDSAVDGSAEGSTDAARGDAEPKDLNG